LLPVKIQRNELHKEMSSFGFIIIKHDNLTNENNSYNYKFAVFKVGFRWRGVVNAIMNLRFPQIAGSFLTSTGPVSFSEKTLLHGVS
jgi:hypothetical protein